MRHRKGNNELSLCQMTSGLMFFKKISLIVKIKKNPNARGGAEASFWTSLDKHLPEITRV